MILPQVAPDIDYLLQPGTALQGAILTVVACSLMPLIIVWARRLFPGQFVHFARWGFSHVLIAMLAYITLSILVGVALVPSNPDGPAEIPIEVQLMASALVQGLVCALIFYWASKRDPQGVRSLGLWPGRHLTALFTGLFAYALCIPMLIGLQLTWPWLLERMGDTFEPQSFQDAFLEASGPTLWFAVGLAVLVIPLLEEILFRAFLQPLLVQNFRDKGGIVLTSLFFAALHGSSAFLQIFGLSLVLGAVMLRTQRLIAVWGVHAVHNGWQIALLLAARDAGGLPAL